MTHDKLVEKVKNLVSEKNKQEKRIQELENRLSGELVVKSLKIQSGDSPYNIVLASGSQYAGIWVNGQKADGIATMYAMNGQGAVVGVWGEEQKKALDVAISAKGGASIQLYNRDNDEIFFVNTSNVSSIAKKHNI